MTTLVFCAMWWWSTGYGMDTIHSICHHQRLWKALALYAGHFGPGLLIGIWWQSKTDCPDCHLWRVEGAGKQETKCFETFVQICGWSFGLTCFCSDFLEIPSTFPRHSLDIPSTYSLTYMSSKCLFWTSAWTLFCRCFFDLKPFRSLLQCLGQASLLTMRLA